jgi:hypothetical protein
MYRSRNTYGETKYAGRSRAVVLDNRDPLNRGQIRVDHPILGQTAWIDYLKSPGSFDVPSIGDIVYVECDSGEYEFPIAWGNITKGLDEAPEIPEVFKRTVPTNRGLYSPGGHTIEIDDGLSNPTSSPKDKDLTTKNRGIRVTSSANNKIHIIEDSDNGQEYILLEDKNGNMVKLDYKNNELTIKSLGTTNFDTTKDRNDTVGGNLTVNVTGNSVVNAKDSTITASGKSTITATGDATITSSAKAIIKGSSGTDVGDGGSVTQVKGQQVLVAGGGPGVARVGDRAIGIGNLGGPVSSVIIVGSTKVLSG